MYVCVPRIALRVIYYLDQQLHNIVTVMSVSLDPPFSLIWIYLGVNLLALLILLYQIVAFVFSNFSSRYLLYEIDNTVIYIVHLSV